MPAENELFNDGILKKIRNILELCSVHRASISFRSTTIDAIPTEYTRVLAWEPRAGATRTHPVNTLADNIFHIASITKILVGTAITHAIKVKAEEVIGNNRWSKFRGIQKRPIRDVYNEYKPSSAPEMGLIPGNPTTYELLVHSSGLPSCNDCLLAPDGTPLMELQGILAHLPNLSRRTRPTDASSRWTSYSNMNFAVIALMIEVCWNGGLDDFMEETLFRPLNMHSTSIGLPPNRITASQRWTVDQHGTPRSVQVPDCRATGAEAAALGAYSTAEDLDTFFSSVIDASRGIESATMKGFSETVNTLLRMENKWVDSVMVYTPFGLETTPSGSTIGCLSSSGLQFPTERFTKYPVVPDKSGQEYLFYYMAGSAVGSSCATAFRVDTERDFALTVLTDTSGPVPAADHILRLVLRRYLDLYESDLSRRLLSSKGDSVRKMVTEAKKHATQNWIEKDEQDRRLRQITSPEPFDIEGTYNGVEVPQQLHVVRRADGKLHLSMSGINGNSGQAAPTSGYFDFLWKDDTHLWLCVPPHISIDRLDNGDWSDMQFEVVRDANGAIELKRMRMNGTECRYMRQA